ncbi:MAG: hypothetical protein IKK91_11840 [Ruminococcus sp.]|nr:hypothetical protein [Ruminococcus sp.]
MAINKTIFSSTTAQTNAADVTAWLQANATEYFASITNESNIITCTIAGGGQLVIKPDQREWQVVLKNGTSIVIDHYGTNDKVGEAYVTSKGIALRSGDMWIFVVKSNSDTIGIVFNATNNNDNIIFADFYFSTSFFGDLNNTKHLHAGMTSLCLCPLGNGGTYGEGLYFVPFYEYNSSGLIYVNGKSYVYSVFMALEE